MTKILTTLAIILFTCLANNAMADQMSGDTPVITLNGPQVICVWVDSAWTDSGYTLTDKQWPKSDITVVVEGCSIEDFNQGQPGIYKYRYRANNKSGNNGISKWRYIIRKARGDNSPCILTDSLKDSCYKLTPTSGIARQPDLLKSLKIYPNPADQTLNISIEDDALAGPINIRILDMQGKCMHQQSYTSAKAFGAGMRIPTNALPNGVYVVELSNGNAVLSKCVVVGR